jgi:hypothetical protein
MKRRQLAYAAISAVLVTVLLVANPRLFTIGSRGGGVGEVEGAEADAALDVPGLQLGHTTTSTAADPTTQFPTSLVRSHAYCFYNGTEMIASTMADVGPCVRERQWGPNVDAERVPVRLVADATTVSLASIFEAVGADVLAEGGGGVWREAASVAVATNATVRLVANPTQVSYATLAADCGAADDAGLIRCAARSLSVSMRRAWLAGANIAYNPFGSLGFWAARGGQGVLPDVRYLGWWQLGNLRAGPAGGTGIRPANLSAATIAADADAARHLATVARSLGMDILIPGHQGHALPASRFPTAPDRDSWFGHRQPRLATARGDAAQLQDDVRAYYRAVRSAQGGDEATGWRGSSGRRLWALVDVGHESALAEDEAVSLAASVVGSIPGEVGWMCQGWMGNPTSAVVRAGTAARGGEPPVILDLDGEWSRSLPVDRVFCATPNFGGRLGIHGRLARYARGARRSNVGVCAASEAPNVAADAEETVLLAAWSGVGIAIPSGDGDDAWPLAKAAAACSVVDAVACRSSVAPLWARGGPLNILDESRHMPPFASPLLGGTFGRLDHVPYDWSLLRAAARDAVADYDRLCDGDSPSCRRLQHTALDLLRQLLLDAAAAHWQHLQPAGDLLRCHLSRILSADATAAWTAVNFTAQATLARVWSPIASPALTSYAHQQRTLHVGAFDVNPDCTVAEAPQKLDSLYRETIRVLRLSGEE